VTCFFPRELRFISDYPAGMKKRANRQKRAPRRLIRGELERVVAAADPGVVTEAHDPSQDLEGIQTSPGQQP
jgi:hypothetical protein